jgi:hypothetical protein
MSLWEFLGVIVLALVCRKLYKIELEFQELNRNMRMIQMNFIKELIKGGEPCRERKKKK